MPYSFSHGLSRLGCENVVFDYTRFLPSRDGNRYVRKIRNWLARAKGPKQTAAINAGFLELVKTFAPQLVIVFKGVDVLPETIRAIQACGTAIINCHVDDFFNPRYLKNYSRESFGRYDMHFSSRRHLFEEYKQNGVRAIGFYEFGYDPSIFYPVSPNGCDMYQCDLSFVGSCSQYRSELIEALGGLEARVHLWGWGWKRAKQRLDKHGNIKIWNRLAYLEDFCRVAAGSKICLNILTPQNRDQSNLRNFEIPACRGFQLAPRSEQILRVFRENESIACYNGPGELREKVVHFLGHPQERESIRQAGYEVLLKSSHTFADRCEDVLSQVHDTLGL